jgi:WD40 repeat protein
LLCDVSSDENPERNTVIRLWGVESGHEIRRFKKHDDWVVAFSPDGHTGVSGGIDGAVRLWELPLF